MMILTWDVILVTYLQDGSPSIGLAPIQALSFVFAVDLSVRVGPDVQAV